MNVCVCAHVCTHVCEEVHMSMYEREDVWVSVIVCMFKNMFQSFPRKEQAEKR